MTMGREPVLAKSVYFEPWEWHILAVDPMQEIYGWRIACGRFFMAWAFLWDSLFPWS